MTVTKQARVLGVAALLTVLAATGWRFAAPRLDPAQMLERSWAEIALDIEQQAWRSLTGKLAPEYRDGWGFGREEAVGGLRLARRAFTRLDVRFEDRRAEIDGTEARTRAVVRLDGEGNAGAMVIQRRVNGESEPWTFTWRRQAWLPWTWQLIRVEHPSLSLEGLETLAP